MGSACSVCSVLLQRAAVLASSDCDSPQPRQMIAFACTRGRVGMLCCPASWQCAMSRARKSTPSDLIMVSWSRGLVVSWSHGLVHGLVVSCRGLVVSWSHGLVGGPALPEISIYGCMPCCASKHQMEGKRPSPFGALPHKATDTECQMNDRT